MTTCRPIKYDQKRSLSTPALGPLPNTLSLHSTARAWILFEVIPDNLLGSGRARSVVEGLAHHLSRIQRVVQACVRVEVKVEIVPVAAKVTVVKERVAIKVLIKVDLSRLKVAWLCTFTEARDVTRRTQRSEHRAQLMDLGVLLVLKSLQMSKVHLIRADLIQRRRSHGRLHDGR